MKQNNFASPRRVLFFFMLLFLSVLVTFCQAEEIEFTFQNTFDNTQQKAVVFVPDICKTKKENPLLVVAHYMGGTRYTAKNQGYYPECETRGFLLVCPELHGHRTNGKTSLSALEAQYDILGAITYMKRNYSVDTSRIYIVGRSMGGMLSQVMGAKYPDLFAAVVSGQGISDLKLWAETTIPDLKNSVEMECNSYSETTRFDYERRSSIYYAPNFQYVPLILWHGTNDTWVPPEQSEFLVTAIRHYNRFQPDVNWLHCAPHCADNFTPEWVCDQLQYYQNVCEANTMTPTRFFPELNIVTDEAKRFYWLGVTPAKTDAFARIQASLRNDVLLVQTENVRDVVVDLDHVSQLITFSNFDIRSDTQLHLSIERNGKTLFETTAELVKTGLLPKSLFER